MGADGQGWLSVQPAGRRQCARRRGGGRQAATWIMQWWGVTVTPGMRCWMRRAATSAFDCPTSCILRPPGRHSSPSGSRKKHGRCGAGSGEGGQPAAPTRRRCRRLQGARRGAAHLNRNWRLRLDTSMVSMSITSMLPKPLRARSLSSSQPSPPAPTTSTLHRRRRGGWEGPERGDGVSGGGASPAACASLVMLPAAGLLVRRRGRQATGGRRPGGGLAARLPRGAGTDRGSSIATWLPSCCTLAHGRACRVIGLLTGSHCAETP